MVVIVVAEVVVDVLVLEVEDSLSLSLPPQATVMVLTANAAAMAAVTESRREIRWSVMSALAPVSRESMSSGTTNPCYPTSVRFKRRG